MERIRFAQTYQENISLTAAHLRNSKAAATAFLTQEQPVLD